MGFFDWLKKASTRKSAPERNALPTQTQEHTVITDPLDRYRVKNPESQMLMIVCDPQVRERILTLGKGCKIIAEQWYQALNDIFSNSPQFTTASWNREKFTWLTKPVAFQSSAGVFFFGIDEYEDGQWPILCEEKDWTISTHLITDTPEKLCEEIALTIEEALGLKLSWKVSECTFLTLNLQVAPKRQAYIRSINVHFSSNKQNEYDMTDDYEAFCFYESLFTKADNFSILSKNDIAGGTNNNGITNITYCAKNGKKVYLNIDGGFPVPELADSDMHTEDCSEEMIQEIVAAVEKFFNIRISQYQCIPVLENAYALQLYEA